MPATLPEVVDAIGDVLADGAAMTADELVAALRHRELDLGVDPAGTIDEALGWDSDAVVMPLRDGPTPSILTIHRSLPRSSSSSASMSRYGWMTIFPHCPGSRHAKRRRTRRAGRT